MPDQARAEIFIRLVDDGNANARAAKTSREWQGGSSGSPGDAGAHLGSLPGFETTVVAFTTDIPAFGESWGRPYLLGPGTIHVAHTSEERIPKREILEAIQIYKRMVKQLTQ